MGVIDMSYRRGWNVVVAGTGINLALGVLYAWSVFKSAIVAQIEAGGAFAWPLSAVNDPFSVCLLTFAGSTVVAGRMQDRFSPRVTAMIGGLLVGAGFCLCSLTASYLGWVVGFGLLGGAGIGFGYASATPPALKWFPPAKTGLIAGIVVAGFGLAPVYIAPVATWLLASYGVQQAMLILGLSFASLVALLSIGLVNPPADYCPLGLPSQGTQKTLWGFGAMEMMRTKSFWALAACYFFGAGAGLMVIGFAKGLAQQSMGPWAFILVSLMAVGNAGGRVIAGDLSDRIGRRRTMLIMFLFQAGLMFWGAWLVQTAQPAAVFLILLATFIGFNYGTNASLFPAFVKDFYGMRCFGMNNGILLTAWGIGGFILTRVSQMMNVATGSYQASFLLGGCLLLGTAALTFTLKQRETVSAARERLADARAS